MTLELVQVVFQFCQRCCYSVDFFSNIELLLVSVVLDSHFITYNIKTVPSTNRIHLNTRKKKEFVLLLFKILRDRSQYSVWIWDS